jgi:hypothetical protein
MNRWANGGASGRGAAAAAPPVPVPPEAAPADESPFVPMSEGSRTLLVGVYLAYFACVCLASLVSPNGSTGEVVLALGVYIALLLAPVVLYRDSWGWFHPLVFTSLYALLSLLRKFPMYTWGLEAHEALPGLTRPELMELVAAELALGCVGLVAYYVGFLRFPSPPLPTLRFVRPRAVQARALVVVALALVVFVVALRMRGGLTSHLLMWRMSRKVANEGMTLWSIAVTAGAWATLFWAAADLRSHRRPLFWAAALASIFADFLFTGSRGSVLALVAVGFMVRMMATRRVMYVRTLALGVAGVVLIGGLGQFRAGTRDNVVNWGALTAAGGREGVSTAWTETLVQRATSGHGALPILARVPEEEDLLYGKSYLAVLTVGVPRSVWPEKPGLIDGRVGRTFYDSPAGKPAGAVAEAYWNFHVPGVILVFLLFGIFQQWLARMVRRYPGQPAMTLLYLSALWMLAVPTSMSAVRFIADVVPLLLVVVMMGGLKRARIQPRTSIPSGVRPGFRSPPLHASARP